MNTVVAKLECKWVHFTFRHRLTICAATTKVQHSTFPPEPAIPSKKPYKVDLTGGKRYSWCTCGHSNKQPFCDGAHKAKGQGMSPHRFSPVKDVTAWLCGCKHTNNPPFCDGSTRPAIYPPAVLWAKLIQRTSSLWQTEGQS